VNRAPSRQPWASRIGVTRARALPPGKLAGLPGEYPVWVDQPIRPQDVPGSLERAWHEAQTRRGPALVIVPMDDWQAPAPEPYEHAAPDRLVRAAAADAAAVEELAQLLEQAESPALVAGAGADDPETWAALAALAERLVAPVWQEPFGARAGFPQEHPLYAGDLSADRARLREALSGHDVVLVVGGPAFRQYAYAEGPFVEEGTVVAVVTEDPAEAHRSRAQLAVLAPPASVCAALAERLPQREGEPPPSTPAPEPPAPGDALRAGHVLSELAARLPRDAIVLEEAPSNRPELLARLPAKENLGLISPAMGGLGFAMPAAIGLRLALPSRPVVAIIGDGSSLYAIQSLWSEATYKSGALFVILKNGGYAIMDRLAEHEGGASAWPNVDVDIAGLAEIFGCDARQVADLDTLPGARRGRPGSRPQRRAAPARGHRRAGPRLQPLASPRPPCHLDDQAGCPLLPSERTLPSTVEGTRTGARAQLLDRRVFRGLLDSPQQLVARLELAALGRHEPEHDLLVALREEAQRLEAAGALVVPLHEVAVHLEVVQERLGDEVPAPLRRPRGAEVAATGMRGDAHPFGPPRERLVDVSDVFDVLALGVAADRGDVLPLVWVVHVREARVSSNWR
jgi:benzoylformate decarboxylase